MKRTHATGRRAFATRGAQRGQIAILTALSLLVLIGMGGLAIDVGRLMIVKTELQNAADACALAAARELDGQADALTRAENAGVTVGARNSVNLQASAVPIVPASVTFSASLHTGYLTNAGGAAAATAKYAMCTLGRDSLSTFIMGAVGVGNQQVFARAVATVAPSQTNCAIPLGLCGAPGVTTAPYGLTAGQWSSGRYKAGSGATGNYDWIDFTPPGGGASEVSDLITGTGQCSLPAAGTKVGQSGLIQSLETAWNTRFGLYKGGAGQPNETNAPPDRAGYAYSALNWPSQAGATSDFLSVQRAGNVKYEGDNLVFGSCNGIWDVSAGKGKGCGNYNNTTNLATKGADRRIATAPIVDCAAWAGAQTIPILDWACVLMLHPIGSAGDEVKLEFIGLANVTGSPCASSGLAGGTVGPLVPVLVQ
jgi:Flp pilus assembly protein TadG